MNLSQIILYTVRALSFSLAAGILWTLFLHRRKGLMRKLPFVCYLAALIQITVIRDWRTLFVFPKGSHTLKTVQLFPLRTTLAELTNGAWPFCFHVIGNMIWFVPLGILGPALFSSLRSLRRMILCAACLSACIELGQWCLATGVTDIDDVILNTAGAVCGFMIWNLLHQRIVTRIVTKRNPEKQVDS